MYIVIIPKSNKLLIYSKVYQFDKNKSLKMHNIWVRLNAVIFFALTVLLGLAILCALSSYLHAPLPLLKTLKLNELKSFRSHRGDDIALLFFDLDADLSRYAHISTSTIILLLLLLLLLLSLLLLMLLYFSLLILLIILLIIIPLIFSAFHWNIKQLFVFVVAEFETPLNPLNQVLLLLILLILL